MEVEDNAGVGMWEAQTIGYKRFKDALYYTGNIANILWNNCKWKLTFKNCIHRYIDIENYTSIKKKKNFKQESILILHDFL